MFFGQLLQDLPVDVYRYDLMVGILAQINGYVFSRWATAQDYYFTYIFLLFPSMFALIYLNDMNSIKLSFCSQSSLCGSPFANFLQFFFNIIPKGQRLMGF